MKKDNNKNNKLTDEEIDLIATKIVSKLIDITDLANWYRTSTYKVSRESFELSEEEELLSELAKCMTLMNVYTDKEEYEKCAILKKRITTIKRKLKKYDQ